MPVVVGVQLRYSKTLWFDPAGTDPAMDDLVVVKTSRGEELGQVRRTLFELDDPTFDRSLKPVLRIANERDLNYQLELGEKEKDAMPVFYELVTKYELPMHPVDVEYLISGDKIVFYFSSEERVDFRELVRELSSRLEARIDMRQVGVRDEARMIGGLSHCGEQLCCARLGGEFAPVSIKMAKDQGLPLNPTKISGLCGRLMCCLRYEVEAYNDFNSRAPRKGSFVDVSDGSQAKVCDLDAVREMVSLRFPREDMPDETLTIKLCDLQCEKSGKYCQCKVDAKVLDEQRRRAQEQHSSLLVGNARFLDTVTDATPAAAQETAKPAKQDAPRTGASKDGDKRRRRSRRRKPSSASGSSPAAAAASTGAKSGAGSGAQSDAGARKPAAASKDDRVPRRRRR
ncbi:MAG: tpl protein [Actinomycetia bacterium]|nr:tpl protein [Actinomycetes bacterium]